MTDETRFVFERAFSEIWPDRPDGYPHDCSEKNRQAFNEQIIQHWKANDPHVEQAYHEAQQLWRQRKLAS